METGAIGARSYPSPLVSLRLCLSMLLANNQNSRLSSIGKSMRLHSFHLPSLTSLGIPILKYSTPVLKVLCITCLIIRHSHRNPLRCHSHPPFIFLSVILNVFGALDQMRLHESQSSSSPGKGGQHCEGTRGSLHRRYSARQLVTSTQKTWSAWRWRRALFRCFQVCQTFSYYTSRMYF